VELQGKVSVLDPAEWLDVADAEAALTLDALIYDRLVRLGRRVGPKPPSPCSGSTMRRRSSSGSSFVPALSGRMVRRSFLKRW
jgi:hypothetical protein